MTVSLDLNPPQRLGEDALDAPDRTNGVGIMPPEEVSNPGCSWADLEWELERGDPRLLREGRIIPAKFYADQPYVVRTATGAWVCVLTTGDGQEGSRGQHVISLRSEDHGQTWSEPVCIEPPTGPEASWVVPLLLPSGRIVAFYVFNREDIRELPADDPPFPGGITHRMDSHGHYVFRWSDDEGRTWSEERGEIPVREFAIDRENSTGGRVRLFWNVGKPRLVGGAVVLPLHKVGGFGHGWFTRSEGAFVVSEDLANLADPREAAWVTLPEGDVGLRTPPGGGPIAEEQCVCELGDGSLFSVYRSIDGFPVGTYSRNRGRTWSTPASLTYADGRRVKHPRAACFVWRLAHGGYVLWFHNHGGEVLGKNVWRACRAYEDRNPVWMARGWEVPGRDGVTVVWGNPEIVLYEDDPLTRISYPDLIEEGDTLFLTETQKSVARVHALPAALARALRHGPEGFAAEDLVRESTFDWTPAHPTSHLPPLPFFVAINPKPPYGTTDMRAGFTMECAVTPGAPGVFARSWHPARGGFQLEWTEDRRVRILVSDGRLEFSWSSDAGLWANAPGGSVCIALDGGPRIITMLVDGVLCDGGTLRASGWGRFSKSFHGTCANNLTVKPRFEAVGPALKRFRIYPRALLSAEMETLFRHHRMSARQ
ncbi:MAG: exo-alpha-sialidase [Chthoniobacterales bacterium]|mgnify:CR=1 FL=1|nr:exo-alpha-sialidase [Chthoniobacterales bacterium]